MTRNSLRFTLLPLAACAIVAAAPDPFAYTLEMTPEEGPVVPAIERRYTAAFQTCQQQAEITPDIASCYVAEFPRQDAALNRAWSATLHRLPAASHAALLAAQRKWIAARDRFCDAKSDEFRGGTIVPIIYANCRVEQTIRRTIWLERL